jgi:excisionase family DNA binding protein
MASASKPLMTPDETAEYLGISAETLAQWRSQRRGPAYIKLEGRLVRYRLSALESYLEQRIVSISIDRAHSWR